MVKQAWVGQIVDLESDVALIPAVAFKTCGKKSFTQSCYFCIKIPLSRYILEQ
jgi:hypothetical protein